MGRRGIRNQGGIFESRPLKDLGDDEQRGVVAVKESAGGWSMELGLETNATDTANGMRRRIYGEINDRMEDGLREHAGGTKKPKKVTQTPKVKSAEGIESPRKKNEEIGKANGMEETI